MKNTQKLLLFLSTVMLATGIGSSMVAAMGYNLDVVPINMMGDAVEGELMDGAGPIPENVFNTDFRLSVIWVDNNRITVVFDQDNQMLKSITLAYFDYENGATEAEADAKLSTLGEETSGVWALLAERHYDKKAMMGLFSVAPDQHKVAENKTDIIYYAAEFEVEQPGGGVVTKWVRGKVNYRRCVHAPQYEERQAGVCNENVEGDRVVFWMNDMGEPDIPADLQVITWEEEWRQIQAARLKTAEAAVLAAKEQVEGLAELETSLNATETVLEKLLVTLATLPDTAELKTAQELLEIIASLKGKLLTNDVDESMAAENKALIGKVAELSAKVADLEANNGELKGQVALSEARSDELKAQIMTLEAEKVSLAAQNATLVARVTELEEVVAQPAVDNRGCKTIDNGEVTTTVATGGGNEAANVINNGNMNSVVSEKVTDVADEGEAENGDAAVEIPKLGGGSMNFWWLVVPLGGVLVMCALWLKRMFGREK